MAIGAFFKSRQLLSRDRASKRKVVRQVLMETLESRQLLAVGPQLIGVQPTADSLLDGGEVLQVSPRELVFRFDDAVGLDPESLSGIRVVRADKDGLFERATVATDFGTNGQTLVEFYAREAGEAGNGITLQFSRVSRADSRLPRVNVSGRVINVELNSNPSLQTRVQDLLQVFSLEGNSAASQLVYALRLRGSDTIAIGQTTDINRSYVLAGAGAAKAATDFGLGNTVSVQFLARNPGNEGTALRINVTAQNLGATGKPIVTVNGQNVNVVINNNQLGATTIQDFIGAINAPTSPSSNLIEARLVSGSSVIRVGALPTNYSPITFTGVGEVEVLPGYIGFGDNDREVVLRFAERLPQDRYRIDILGQGNRALRNIQGEAFNEGVSRSIVFELNLGARIESVVPQPVFRNSSGTLTQQRNQVDLYFNTDPLIELNTIDTVNGMRLADLEQLRTPLFLQNSDTIRLKSGEVFVPSVLDVSFYQLIHTAETLDTRDDVRFLPNAVRYFPSANRVSLIYSNNLEELRHPITNAVLPAADLRLRVGASDSAPLPPVLVDALVQDPSDTFDSAMNLGGTWTPGAGGTQSVLINSQIRNTTPFLLDFPGGSDEPGNRRNRHQDNLRLAADSVDGISTIYFNFQSNLGRVSNSMLLNAITEQQKQRVREAFSLYERYLGVRFVESNSLGLTVAVGDMRAVEPFEEIPGSGIPGQVGSNRPGGSYYAAGHLLANRQLATVLDVQDFEGSTLNEFGGPFQRAAMQAIGRLLGLGLADEVEGLTVMAFNGPFVPAVSTEIVLPGDVDIVHGRYLYRPDSKDIDLYQFHLPVRGRISIEAFAERMSSASLLDTAIRLYQQNPDGKWEEISANDDYFGSDSFLQLDLEQGNYIVGVSASGNTTYDPVIGDSGIGGRSQGLYQLRMDFRPPAQSVLRDSTGLPIDGNSDGKVGGEFNFWFRPAGPSNTRFVDKSAPLGGNGSINAPFKNIRDALATEGPNRARSGDVVRIVGNGGQDNRLETLSDNLAYEIGFDSLGRALPDGSTFDVPRGVTVMIDAGAILKMRRSRIGVGSSSSSVDRSGGSLLVLGTPRLLDANGNVILDSAGQPIPGSVYFTSLSDATIGRNANPAIAGSNPQPGDWGGIDFRNRVDQADPNRINNEAQGQFLNWVAHADLRFGGGQVVIDGVSQVVTPIQMIDARPTIGNSAISRSADAAMSATANSFLDSNFHSPREQSSATAFTVDYQRSGPEIFFNRVIENSINGLQIRLRTQPSTQLEHLTVPGRFGNSDIVHFIPENLVIRGNPTSFRLTNETPASTLVTSRAIPNGNLAPGNYRYIFTQLINGVESIPSEPTQRFAVTSTGSLELSGIPVGVNRIYRSSPNGEGPYVLVGQLSSSISTFVDNGANLGVVLNPSLGNHTATSSARLAIDPGVIVKLQGSRIEASMGGQLIAEGNADAPVVFTSVMDNRYGAGGTFRTTSTQAELREGDWGGIFVGHTSRASLDHIAVTHGGGTTRIEGGFSDFNAIEIHQGDLRLTNSRLENNQNGSVFTTDPLRGGRGWNSSATIFIRGAQPIIASNIIQNNSGPAISINVNALNHQGLSDWGRSRGELGRIESVGNRGPLVRENRLDGNTINGMVVRGGVMTTEGVWDDTDIVHVVLDEIVVSDHHHFGGLRLMSNPGESLVVKLSGETAGLTARGLPLDNADRIGGSIQIVGQPNYPVILTSLSDNSVGAGFTPLGTQQLNTIPDAAGDEILPTGPEVNNGLLIDNDVPVNIPGFFSFEVGPGGRSDFSGRGGITAQGRTQLLIDENVVFAFENYIDVGSNGQAFSLAATQIVTPPTLVGPDFVVSEGTFEGENGIVAWRVETFMDNGIAKLNNRLILTSENELGNIRFINYLDEDIRGVSDDLMYIVGTPGEEDFRVFTLDGPERVGFSQGGIYLPTPGDLEGAFYVGWAADRFPLLQLDIENDGTQFSFAGNINTDNLPPFVDPQLGLVYGLADVTTAFAWNVDTSSTRSVITSFLELVPRNPGSAANPGDWRSILLDTYSNDRNIAVVFENESSLSAAAGTNDSTNSSQFLGSLAADEKSGDENDRLGFHIYGNIARPSDVDVYSFWGYAGTQVWLDIDNTDNSLDTVVELVDAEGRTLALSLSSFEEEADPSLLYRASDMPEFSVNPLRKSPLEFTFTSAQGVPKDLFSTNPRDAGMRVVLPGQQGANGLYHVRVRSSSLRNGESRSNLLLPNSVGAGLTSGSYTLQIRLNSIDEVPGSGITYADIRFATRGIEVRGVPGNSPLLGENSEVEVNFNGQSNNTIGGAQPLGNLLQTNRQALSVAGFLDSTTDVDWFSFDLRYERVTPTALRQYFATIFDVDYADGIGRPDISIFVFDANGNLMLSGLGSGLVDDQAGPLSGADNSDLSRGSFGVQDPFIGSVELPMGRYFLAVTNSNMTPGALSGLLDPASENPLVRVLPIEGVQYIAQDHVDPFSGSTAIPPIYPVLFDPSQSIIPYDLSDMVLYVSQDFAPRLSELTNVFMVNPFTGQVRNQLGQGLFDIQDIAFRGNREVGYNLQAFTRTFLANVGADDRDDFLRYVEIDTQTGEFSAVDAPIQTYTFGGLTGAGDANDGLNPEAITFGLIGGVERGIMVANRPTPPNQDPRYYASTRPLDGIGTARPSVSFFTNLIYLFDIDTGDAQSQPFDDRTDTSNPSFRERAGTAIVERGRIETYTLNPATGAPIKTASQFLTREVTTENPFGSPLFTIQDGDVILLNDSTGFPIRLEFNLGPQVIVNYDPSTMTVSDGLTFTLDGEVYEFDTNGVTQPGRIPIVLNSPAPSVNQFVQAIRSAVQPNGITVGFKAGRMNFSGATTGNFASMVAAGLFTDLGTSGAVGAQNTAVNILASDSAEDVAQRIVVTINTLNLPGTGASRIGNRVQLVGLRLAEGNQGPVTPFGIAPGGIVTGATLLNGRLYAVSDTGGLYVVNNPLTPDQGNILNTYVTTSELTGIRFSALTRGPEILQNGQFSQLLFGLDVQGRIHAFDTAGRLQPVFANGRTNVSTGLNNANGLAFSPLENNLWQVTNRREGDPGHGIPATRTGSNDAIPGGRSFYFGAAQGDFSDPQWNYDFPGGAHGAMESLPFSLAGVSASDLPTLYFNYFLETEEAGGENMRDAFRVYVSGEDAQWRLLATNNDTGQSNEFELIPGVQRLFDNTENWRQVRIPLDRFAGQDNLKIRIEFSTAGGFGYGLPGGKGPEIRTVAGNRLVDGQTLTVNNRTLEIEMGSTLAFPSGGGIGRGTSVTINGQSFEFTDGPGVNPGSIPILYNTSMTASQVAQAFFAVVANNLPDRVIVRDNQVQLPESQNIGISAGANIGLQGSRGSKGIPVNIALNMTPTDVALELQRVLAQTFANGILRAYPIRGGDTISLTGLTGINAGPFGLTTNFVGDAFGSYNAGWRVPGPLQSQNNAFEGVYVDDFIIGLAGRGEMVVGPTGGDTTFIVNPQAPGSEILEGAYQFEIRGGSLYGMPSRDGIQLIQALPIDSRLSDGIAIRFNPAHALVAGTTFTVNDLTRTVTFELDDVNDGNTVQPGNIPLPFSTRTLSSLTMGMRSESAPEIAARFRDIINSNLIQSQLRLSATLLNGDFEGATSDTVVFIGDVDVEVPATVGTRLVSRDLGGSNRKRLQGQIVINAASISNSLEFGALVTNANRDPDTGAPLSGSPRNTITLNDERLAPAAVIKNSEFIFNRAGGIQVVGNEAAQGLPSAVVPFVRLVNNTILGGSATTITNITPASHGGFFFEIGNIAFADAVVSYSPLFGGGPAPAEGLNNPQNALGPPRYTESGEPEPGDPVVSLGRGGQLILQFTNNFLTGSGDSSPDLVVFEVGDSENVSVEVSTDGIVWTNVGIASRLSPAIDIDAFGFNRNSRLSFVRLTDLRNLSNGNGSSPGADIDAVGALSSVVAEQFTASGDGIRVAQNATATILNNVLVNNSNGIVVSATSQSTVIGGSVYQRNTNNVVGNSTLGQFPLVVGPVTPLFTSPAFGNLYPAQGSRLIDSSIDSLLDRASLVAVKRPLGYAASPILAPAFDINGQLRVDDPSVSPPPGMGGNVFKDRGAQERGDFSGPKAFINFPADNDLAGLDRNPEPSIVELVGTNLRYFDLRLIDGLEPADPSPGSGLDHSTVSSASVLLYRNGQPLVEGVDYRFGYDATNGVVRLQPLAGIWRGQSAYTIRMLNTRKYSVVASNADRYNDGDAFEILDINGRSTRFEFDLGYTIIIPASNGVENVLSDGQTFSIDDGNTRLVFEFDTDGQILQGNQAVDLSKDTSLRGASEAMVAAINGTLLRVTARVAGPGRIQLQGDPQVRMDTQTSGLLLSGQPGVQPGFGLAIPLVGGNPQNVTDGQTFAIIRGGNRVTFEFDTNGTILPGNVPVRIVPNSTAQAIGTAMVNAINGSSIGLAASYAGGGIVLLSGDDEAQLDLTNTLLTQVGRPGQSGSVPIALPSNANATQVGQLIRQAIESAGLIDLEVISFGNRLLLEGATGVTGVGANVIGAIRDRAGNPLQPNQLDGSTTLTVFLGEGFDYGDAPEPYASLRAENGPRHRVVNGLSLGPTVTVDVDARLPNADLDDGVTFSPLYASFQGNAGIEVVNTTGRQAYVSMWIDFNGDGFFSSAELVADAIEVSPGLTTVSFLIPANAAQGETYSRIRLSTDRASIRSPLGQSPDGEVEDWAVNIQSSPFTNPIWNLDVNASGRVSPIDALQVINWLNDPTKPRELTLSDATFAPPFIDVNGDGRVTANDALLVINYLNSRPPTGGAEGEMDGAAFAPTAIAGGSSTQFGASTEATGQLNGQLTVMPGDWASGLFSPSQNNRPEGSINPSLVRAGQPLTDWVLSELLEPAKTGGSHKREEVSTEFPWAASDFSSRSDKVFDSEALDELWDGLLARE